MRRKKFDEPEDVASYRMRGFHLEEIARRFTNVTVLGVHGGNPEYEWPAEVARRNPIEVLSWPDAPPVRTAFSP